MFDAADPNDDALTRRAETRFLRRVLIVGGVVVVALFLWATREALLLGFAAILAGLVLDAVARPFSRWFGWSRRWALLAGGGLLVLLLAGAGLLIGAQLAAQVGELGRALPEAASGLQRRLGLGEDSLKEMAGGLLGQATSVALVAADALSALVLAVVAGVFLAGDPPRFKRGLLQLAPRSAEARLGETLEVLGNALHNWLLATCVAMLIIGIAAAAGSWAIGLPAPLALGLFAGLAQFVPLLGSIVGAIPAVLLAASQGSEMALWTIGLFLLIQQVESNMITPLIEQKLVQIDAPLLLFGVVAAGALFGLPGLLLAAPLTVVAAVAVQRLYIRDTLGRSTEVPGEG